MDFHFSFHLNSEEVYETIHSDPWLHLPRGLEHLTTAKQDSRAPATKMSFIPKLDPQTAGTLEPVQSAMQKA